jgi:hypothetical protein
MRTPDLSRRRSSLRPAVVLVLAGLCLSLGGCNIIGAVAAKAPKPDIQAAYKGLAGKSVGIMVYVDPATQMDFPRLQLDLGNSLDYKLKEAQKEDKDKDLLGTTFPYEPRSFIRYQKEHPGLDALPITEVAPKLGVDRLIYVQVNQFSTRPEGMINMYLGRIDVTLQVIEVEKQGDKKVAKIAYTDPNIRIKFPRSAPQEGVLNKSDQFMYIGTVGEVTTEMALRFFRHPDESAGVVDPDA